ncbi:MAG: N-acetylglucosamine-6-phosphate deacetylase [Actinobacteria bacterium]|nr:N-acetylglucosamine-6-phosphate deacetylase [Actinomycetota bacterium]
MNNYILKNGIILTPFKEVDNHYLFVRDGKIEKICSDLEFETLGGCYLDSYELLDAKGYYISPGFIDIHTHGQFNVDANQGLPKPLTMSEIRTGVTSFLPTLWTTDFKSMLESAGKYYDFINTSNNKGAKILGINMEGPFLNPLHGGQKPENTRIPSKKDCNDIFKLKDFIKIMTISPDVENIDIAVKFCNENNTIISIGHCYMEPDQLHDIVKKGARLVTHMFNAMGRKFSSRYIIKKEDELYDRSGIIKTGFIEEIMLLDNIMCELICDSKSIHVPPVLLKIIIKCMGVDKLILITDSMKPAGCEPGKYSLEDGRDIFIFDAEDPVGRLEDGEVFGSIETMNRVVKNIRDIAGIKIKDAVKMAAYNPAYLLGLDGNIGSLLPGRSADICIFDNDLNIKYTFVNGEIVYKSI